MTLTNFKGTQRSAFVNVKYTSYSCDFYNMMCVQYNVYNDHYPFPLPSSLFLLQKDVLDFEGIGNPIAYST